MAAVTPPAASILTAGGCLDTSMENKLDTCQDSEDDMDDGMRGASSSDKKKAAKRHKQLTIKGPWSKDEDDVVVRLVGQYGPKRWSLIASNLPGRTGKQCRERWHNQLDPNIKKEGWTDEEDRVLLQAHNELGNHWVDISKRLPGRTDNAIKNRWNSTMRKRLMPSPARDTAAKAAEPVGGIKPEQQAQQITTPSSIAETPSASKTAPYSGRTTASSNAMSASSDNKAKKGVISAAQSSSSSSSSVQSAKRIKTSAASWQARPHTATKNRRLGDSQVETIASFGSARKHASGSPLQRDNHTSDNSMLEDSPVGHDDTMCSANTTLLDNDMDASILTRTPGCYSSSRKRMRPLDSEMRKSHLKDTAHCLFSPPSRSGTQDEKDMLAGSSCHPTQGAAGTPMPHTGFTPGNFSPSTFLLTSPSANALSALRPLTHSKVGLAFSPPSQEYKDVRRPILFSPGDVASSQVLPSLSPLILDSAQKH